MSLAQRMFLVDGSYIDMLKKYGGSSSNNEISKEKCETDDGSILLTLPKTYRSKGEALMKFMNDNGITRSKSQQLLINGSEIPGSNYVDIIHDILRYRDLPAPEGFSILAPILKSLNISRELVTNLQRYKDIMETKSSSNDCHDFIATTKFRRKRNQPIDKLEKSAKSRLQSQSSTGWIAW